MWPEKWSICVVRFVLVPAIKKDTLSILRLEWITSFFIKTFQWLAWRHTQHGSMAFIGWVESIVGGFSPKFQCRPSSYNWKIWSAIARMLSLSCYHCCAPVANGNWTWPFIVHACFMEMCTCIELWFDSHFSLRSSVRFDFSEPDQIHATSIGLHAVWLGLLVAAVDCDPHRWVGIHRCHQEGHGRGSPEKSTIGRWLGCRRRHCCLVLRGHLRRFVSLQFVPLPIKSIFLNVRNFPLFVLVVQWHVSSVMYSLYKMMRDGERPNEMYGA